MADATTCTTPLTWETLVSYWAGDLPAEEESTAETHLMSCARCTSELQQVIALAQGIRADRTPMPEARPGPVLRVVQGERRDAPVAAPVAKVAPAPRRRWIVGLTAASTLAAALVLFLVIPRGPTSFSVVLPPPVRDAVVVPISPPRSAREVRLEPTLGEGLSANGARLRRRDGGWVSVKVVAGPPFTVVVPRADLTPGRYELELVAAGADGHETSRGFYRFEVSSPD